MEQALKNTIIATCTDYRLTLKCFFKDEFQYLNDCYLVPFSHILYTRRQIFSYVYESCGNVCSKVQTCNGHQFLAFIEFLYQFSRWAILKKNVYFEYFLFNKFELTTNTTKIKKWHTVPSQKHVLDRKLTVSQKLSYLHFRAGKKRKTETKKNESFQYQSSLYQDDDDDHIQPTSSANEKIK